MSKNLPKQKPKSFTDELAGESWVSKYDKARTKNKQLEAKLKIAVEALRKINTYKFRGSGPSGCDNHCINHPCGPCVDLPSEKYIAKQALKQINGEDE